MRIALISARRRTDSGVLRAGLMLAGRSVLARQVDLLRAAGCERILCLYERLDSELLRLEKEIESTGSCFEPLPSFLHLPAMVRGEDKLVILADGLLPDPALVGRLLTVDPSLPNFVVVLPAASPLVAQYPNDFERIDAQRHWAGLLLMRGAPVRHLADFPPDAEAMSLLLRLALQARTPCRDLPEADNLPSDWTLVASEAVRAAQERALINRAAGSPDWRRPSAALASVAARSLAPQGLARWPYVAALAGLLLTGGMAAAAKGLAAAGLALAASGALVAALAGALGAMQRALQGGGLSPGLRARGGVVVDALAAATLFFALSPAGSIAPLATLGPVLVGLARLTGSARLLALLADRAVLLGLAALSAAFDLLPQATALLALAMLGGLLLRRVPI
jgi:hypothetical protein